MNLVISPLMSSWSCAWKFFYECVSSYGIIDVLDAGDSNFNCYKIFKEAKSYFDQVTIYSFMQCYRFVWLPVPAAGAQRGWAAAGLCVWPAGATGDGTCWLAQPGSTTLPPPGSLHPHGHPSGRWRSQSLFVSSTLLFFFFFFSMLLQIAGAGMLSQIQGQIIQMLYWNQSTFLWLVSSLIPFLRQLT